MRRSLTVMLACVPLLGAASARAAATPPGATDPRVLEELAQDAARYAEAVKGFREAASSVIKQTYAAKLRAIRGKYEPLIAMNERDEKDRRLDAIAMFEAFLRKYPDDRRWTPDAMFRLAELYYEKSSDEFLTAQEAYQKSLDSPNAPVLQPPKPDYTPTVALYRKLLVEFPNYRLLDAAYYLLGFCLGEMGQEGEARQALLALTCANEYKPLDPPKPIQTTTVAPGKSATEKVGDPYKACRPVRPDSKFLPEAWTRVGEMHFDNGELPQAISAYSRVLAFKDSTYYDKALYKLAWSYYRDNRYPEAIREFDNLVKWADARKASGDKFGSDLRPEAVQYLGVSFSEPDWDGDAQPDGESGLARIQAFYKGRENEPHVREVYQRLGDIYFDSTKYPEAVAVYRLVLQKWPYFADAPKVQDKIVRAYERDRNLVAAAKEREALGRNYTKGSAWYEKNKNDPEALTAAQQLAEDALLTAATNVHAAAQACKTQAGSDDPKKLDQCSEMYATAADLYEKYLAAYPNSKRAYEFSAYYADALYYSGQLDKAIAAYTAVRDSNLDNRFQEDAAFRVVKAYEDIIDRMKAAHQLEDPPVPDETNTKPPVSPMPMPDIYQRYLQALDWYTNNIKNDRVPELRYATAVLLLRYKNWPEARGRLTDVANQYCASKPDVGFKAYDALLKTYFIDYSVNDEELKDCALGRLLTVADQFQESPCGKSPAAAPYLARLNQIRSSVKSTVITQRLKLALENEEKGTDKQLTQCREGGGGIALVTGGAKPGQTAGSTGTPGKSLSTEVDVGLALDLIDLVNQNPKDQDAPTNLNNACVIYERLYQFGEATRCYERLARDYPDSQLSQEAIWNAARNHRRFFEFDQAVAQYLRVADDPKFANFEHRKDALGIAAQLLDNDQQYAKAAQLYKRYADVAEKPGDSAQAYSFACAAYEKQKDAVKQGQCLREFIKRYDKQKEAGEYVVQAYAKLAATAEQGRDKRALLDAYRKVGTEFNSRSLPPATPAAGAAAKADFMLLEEKFKAFQAKPLKFSGKPQAYKKTFDSFTEEAKSLKEEYQRIWNYKDATWTLASFLRSGDIYYEFAQKLVKAADSPPEDVKKLAKQACRLNPEDCGTVEAQYKDAIFQFVTPIEDEAKRQWRSTLDRAAQLGVTNEYVKKARENLSKYLPEEFPFVKDERIGLEYP